jgi:dihydroorotase
MNLLVRGGRVVDPANRLDGPADVLIQDGVVRRVGPRLAAPAGTPVVDAGGRVVTPGLIDMHVHLREPGEEHKETIATGTRAAARGGFTAVACMANTRPVNDTRAVTDYILAEARARGAVRVYPIGAVTRGLQGRELADLGELAEAGCVAYSDDGRPVMSAGLLRQALTYVGPFGRPVISHAEDLTLSEGGVMHEGAVSTELGLRGIPAAAEEVMVARDIALAELTATPVHIAHVSTAAAVRLLRDARARGVPVTGEATPHHLLLTEEALRGYDPNAKMAPPLRTKRDVEACREALADGTLEVLATDHAPHALTDKEVELDHAANGIVGLETAVPLALTHLVRPGVLDLATLVARLTVGPARVLGLPGGHLAPGAPGDVTVLDLEHAHAIDPAAFASRGRNTPFGGWACVGAPWLTVVGGRVVMREGVLVDGAAPPAGAAAGGAR